MENEGLPSPGTRTPIATPKEQMATAASRNRPAVHPILDKRSVLLTGRPADHRDMQEIIRIVDSDERSLAARVDAAVAALGGQPIVSRFTLWYTTRPPVYTAVLRVSPSRSAR